MVTVNLEGRKCTFGCTTLHSRTELEALLINEHTSSRVCVCVYLSVIASIQIFLVDEVLSKPHIGQLGLSLICGLI